MSILETTDNLLNQYVFLKTAGKPISLEKFQLFELWFSHVHKEWEREAKNLEDLITIGTRSVSFFPEVSPEVYKKALNCLSMWQAMTRREEIPGLLTVDEKRERKLREIEKSCSFIPASELAHLREEAATLGDQREDIVSHGTYQLVDLNPSSQRKRTP